jgi:heme exporter protein C
MSENWIKSSRWFLIMGALLVSYTLIGGLLTPLKTGITAANRNAITSNKDEEVAFDIYNLNAAFSLDFVLLSKNGTFWRSHAAKIKNNQVMANFNVRLGVQESGYTDVFIRGSLGRKEKVWMYLANGFWIEKNPSDSLPISNALSPADMKAFKNTVIIDKVQEGFPNRMVLNESIRNLLYHVPMWFSMMFLLAVSMFYAIRYLKFQQQQDDWLSMSFLHVGLLNGILGCITGSLWARVTWQSWWPADDPKLNGVAMGMFMYFAYLILRGSIKDEYQKAKLASIYNILVFPIFMALIAIMPKLADNSLHPGTGGSVGFNNYDLDNTLRLYFYPAIVGWILIFSFIAILRFRIEKIKQTQLDTDIE